jgi:ankyrin repeat protein
LQTKKLYPIHFSVVKGSITDASLLEANVDAVNTLDDFSVYPLTAAAMAGRADMIQLLIDKGAVVNAVCPKGYSALHLAAINVDTSAMLALIKRGAMLDIKDHSGNTPLHAAAAHGRTACVETLLSYEKVHLNDLNTNGDTALHQASVQGHSESVSMLIKNGAALDIKNLQGYIPFHAAVIKGRTECIELLLGDDKVFVNTVHDSENGLTALMMASSCGHSKSVSMLIKNGADLDRKDALGSTALHHAANSGRTECIEVLLGIDKVLVNAANGKGVTALHLSCMNGHNKSVSMLIKNGADPALKDNDGLTSLHHAANNGHKATLILLIKREATLDIDNDGNTPLHHAAANGRTDCIEALLGKDKVLVNCANGEGMTALHLACMYGRRESMSMLIKNGADPNLKNNSGVTALEMKIKSVQNNTDNVTPPTTHNSKVKSRRGETTAPEIVTSGNITNETNTPNFAPGKQYTQHTGQHGKRPPRKHKALDEVKTSITPVDTKSMVQYDEKPADALFDILQAKVAARSGETKQTPFSWADAKLKIDMTDSSDAELAEESMLQAAMLDAAELDLGEESEGGSCTQAEGSHLTLSTAPCSWDKDPGSDAGHPIADQSPLDVVEFAPLTMKWLARADKKGREMLLGRIKRLAEGRRSYALSKRLQGTQNPIYEAKLGGQRILWTKLKRGDTLSILVSSDCLC